MKRVRIVGLGPGHHSLLTFAAAQALRECSFAVVPKKRADDPLVAARRQLLAMHAPDLRIVEVPDPPRDRSPESTATSSGYRHAVGNWHSDRVPGFEQALLDNEGDAAFLVWGDPALYDSTIRIVEAMLERGNVAFDYDVIPGISSIQLLAARHRIVLHDVGEPVHITTARRLAEAIESGQDNLVVLLTGSLELDGVDDWRIWWGGNLGGDDEQLISGRVGDVAARIEAARDQLKSAAGWVMDVYLLRR